MKIYDCFTFFNELELLKLRLKILDKYVDKFIIVEMDKTFTGMPKNFIFEKNKKFFKKYMKKIIYIKAKSPKLNKFYKSRFFKKINKVKLFSILINRFNLGTWKLEHYQRNQISKGLCDLKKEDIVMVSDVDEIPNPKRFEEMKDYFKKRGGIIGFKQKMYYYYLNGLTNFPWIGTKATSYKYFRNVLNNKAQKLRIQRNILLSQTNKKTHIIFNGGWHFSYLGSITEKIKKIESINHTENDTEDNKNLISMKEKIRKGEDLFGRKIRVRYVRLDDSFPEEILKNRRKYKRLLN